MGDLAAAAGVSVKTVRFYTERGVLTETGRSSGGHRRYGQDALDRLRLVKSLRTLGLGLPAASAAAVDGAAARDVLADHLGDVEQQLEDLRWRRAALQALDEVSDDDALALVLPLLGSVAVRPDPEELGVFWRRIMPARFPRHVSDALAQAAVPELPHDPSPRQALAYARLHHLATDRSAAAAIRAHLNPAPQAAASPDPERVARFYEALARAHALATCALTVGESGADTPALDTFVGAYARYAETRDTPAFRRSLAVRLRRERHPDLVRYWTLTAQLAPTPTSPLGAGHGRLVTLLMSTQPERGRGVV
ncbi:MerR family transcriptional regulator [Streptomyces bungoensis]|uniref:helix-turn-helix domain-containing protein n=1 Tax=Streptomyces bungoensis TaxID=285568 RepID=UPI00131C7383|nr:MerR family transcriptional regulator [Streptomyces bungoensis]